VALVRNIVASWPGTDPTGTVVLAAHYDTVSASPGAADDGVGIGTALEVARALSTQGAAPLRNDLVVLLTDAEEPGLLGADAFARERAAGLGESVVLNHEARGAWGAPATFRTTSPNSVLLRALSRAPGAAAESSAEVAFEALPNGTDFSVLAGARLHAVDTAIAAGGAYYHSPVDDLVGEPYRPTPYAIAVLLATIAVALTCHALVRRRLDPAAVATWALLLLAVAGALLALVFGVSGYRCVRRGGRTRRRAGAAAGGPDPPAAGAARSGRRHRAARARSLGHD
jgi:acetylornithine deacetylase/succinyl-diaminopimelate desuccinylase-like protein